MRQTSLLAFDEINRSGLLSKRRLEAYSALYHHGPATASELIQKLIDQRGESAALIDQRGQRLSDLVRLGVAYEVRERKCRVTGRMVIEFGVTNSLPTKPEKRLSKLEVACRRIKELETEVTRLRDQIGC